MIFVTVGTERFPFDRLICAVDELHDVLHGEPVFMQIGCSVYTPSCPYERFLSYEKFRSKIREARIVVSHAGAGTLLMCAELGKVPVMMVRKQCFGEHVDDHQQMLAERMVERGLIFQADNPEQLQQSILRYDELSLTSGGFKQAEPALAQHLKELFDDFQLKLEQTG